ncbi:MAG: hypothetical protein ACQCXQ_00280 [Verrucomicrobiales bacterium]
MILTGLPSHADLEGDYIHHTWFMGVSRARQLLAVVNEPAG